MSGDLFSRASLALIVVGLVQYWFFMLVVARLRKYHPLVWLKLEKPDEFAEESPTPEELRALGSMRRFLWKRQFRALPDPKLHGLAYAWLVITVIFVIAGTFVALAILRFWIRPNS